jgi:hypothetical protein
MSLPCQLTPDELGGTAVCARRQMVDALPIGQTEAAVSKFRRQ